MRIIISIFIQNVLYIQVFFMDIKIVLYAKQKQKKTHSENSKYVLPWLCCLIPVSLPQMFNLPMSTRAPICASTAKEHLPPHDPKVQCQAVIIGSIYSKSNHSFLTTSGIVMELFIFWPTLKIDIAELRSTAHTDSKAPSICGQQRNHTYREHTAGFVTGRQVGTSKY